MSNLLTNQTISSSGSYALMPTSLATLQQFRALYRPDSSGKTVASCRQIAAILLSSLKRELGRLPRLQNIDFVLELLKDLTKYRHSEAYPVVAKMASEHPAAIVRQQAEHVFSQMNDSLKQLWEETKLNPDADLQARLTNLKRTRALPYAPQEVAAVIFSECKALTLRSGADRITEELREFFKHSEEQVRLAACWVIVSDWATSEQHILRETVFVLADLATNARHLGCSNDAFQLLKQIRNLSPFVDSMVGHGEQRANARFAQLNIVAAVPAPCTSISPIAICTSEGESFAPPQQKQQQQQQLAVDPAPSNVQMLSLSRAAFFQRYSA